MVIFADPKLLLFGFTLVFWLIHILRRIFYSLYYWQLKEYRLDRMISAKKESAVKFLYIIFWFFTVAILIFAKKITRLGLQLEEIVFLLYLFLALYSLLLLAQKRWRLPVFTGKMVLLAALVFSTLAVLFLLFRNQFFIFILVLEIFFPIFIFLCLALVQIPTFFIKNRVKNKAKTKIVSLKNLTVIGITGSYGKSSTKEFLYTILSEKYKTIRTTGNINTPLGVSNFILKELTPEHEIFICEIGAYKKGEIKDVCDIIKPAIGILTGLNEQHLALFGSLENIIKTKYELIESLPRSEPKVLLRGLPIESKAFFNAQNKYCLELYQKTTTKKFLYGQGQEVRFPGEENILGAIAVARELGLTNEQINSGLGKIENKFPGIQIKKGVNGITIIDATYSANPDGVIAHLAYLKTWPARKVIVMPCLIELGKASKEIHRKIGRKIGEVCAPVKEPNGSHGTPSGLAIITTKDRFREIREGALLRPALDKATTGKQGFHFRQSYGGQVGGQSNIIFLENPKEIFEKIKDFCQPGDVILLEGRLPQQLISYLSRNEKSST